jgi:hypothetical protein
MSKTKPSSENLLIKEPNITEIREYLRQSKLKGTKFYVQKRRLGESVLRAIEFNLNDIDNNDNLINYLLDIEKKGDKIFVRHSATGIKKVSFLDHS